MVFSEQKHENALRTFQKNTNQLADGICGRNSWMAIAVHMRENTYAGLLIFDRV